MLDSAVFQIDGNFGAVSAISELLVQADEDRILLLPALPKAWSKGEVKGLCLPGYGTISIRWEKGQLVQCHIQCEGEMDTIISYQGSSIPLKLGKSEKMNLLFTDFCKDTGTTN
jgi:alpha-L-fucosidase 2